MIALFLSFFVATCLAACDYPGASVPPGFCAELWANGLSRPRGIWTASNGDILVVESGNSQITVLWDDGQRVSRKVLATQSGLNHGIAVYGDYLYASSPSTLYRWPYKPQDRTVGAVSVVISNIPADGHRTRTPTFDSQGNLYLSLGSAGNVDRDSSHAQVRRFNLQGSLPKPWSSGQLWADGLRNEVGLRFDQQGRLWGVMNGMDNLARADLGGDIHNTNPAEELNLLSEPGKFYGYPYCWAEYGLPNHGKGQGTMWAHGNTINDGIHTDAWCQNKTNVVKPAWPLPPHNAPLDIIFWYSSSFPSDYTGDAFVSMHGSWNRSPPSGYRVQRVHFTDGVPVKDTPFLWHAGSEPWPNGFRPVGLAIKNTPRGDVLLVSSDGTGDIVLVRAA